MLELPINLLEYSKFAGDVLICNRYYWSKRSELTSEYLGRTILYINLCTAGMPYMGKIIKD